MEWMFIAESNGEEGGFPRGRYGGQIISTVGEQLHGSIWGRSDSKPGVAKAELDGNLHEIGEVGGYGRFIEGV